jgi:hypothetical protein
VSVELCEKHEGDADEKGAGMETLRQNAHALPEEKNEEEN